MSRLETGWDAETPNDDTLLRQYVAGYCEWFEAAGRAAGHRVCVTEDFIAVDEASPEWFMNEAFMLRPVLPDRAHGVADRLRAFFSGAGADYVVFSPWPMPPNLEGLTIEGYPPWMLRSPGGSPPPSPPELSIGEVDGTDALRDYERVLVVGFPLEALRPWHPGQALDDTMLGLDGWRMWVGRVEGEPVTVAAAGTSHGLVRVEWVATLPEARGRGYGAAVTWRATTAHPTFPAALLATDAGRPVYQRLGYVPITRFVFLRGVRG